MDNKERLLNLIREKALTIGKVKLSSGGESSYYIDCRVITLSPEGAHLVAKIFLSIIEKENIDAVGGPTLGADPICGAISLLSHQNGNPISTFIVRKEAKRHGAGRRMEGTIKRNSKVMLIDDVATTGGSLIDAAHVVRDLECEVKKALVIVDRLEGARENLENEGIELISIFTREDLISKDAPKTT